MKKQINPKIKAHLIRSAFYVLLLVAVCVIPFALAQRNTRKNATGPAARVALPEQLSTGGIPGVHAVPAARKVTAASQRFAGGVSQLPAGSCTNYNFTLGTDTFVAGVDNIGQSCDDCLTPITLPFPVNLYDQSFTTAMV